MNNKKILITGSSGTIGTRLMEKLILENHDVIGVDWRPNIWSSKINQKTINIDLRDKKDVLDKLPKDIDMVIHLAANARVYNLVKEPSLSRDNFETCFNVLEYARKNNINKFIFASSREVYGNSERYFNDEQNFSLSRVESPYSASKVSGEALVCSYKECYGIDSVILRFSNVYGMYDNSDRVIPLFINLCRKGEELPVYGEDKMLDFTYIDDCIDGIILLINNFQKAKNETYNISFGKGESILRVAQLIKEETKSESLINFRKRRIGEVDKYVGDITKAKQGFDYFPKTAIEEGIKRTVSWYNEILS